MNTNLAFQSDIEQNFSREQENLNQEKSVFNAFSFEVERSASHSRDISVPIEVEAELDFGTIYCWVRSGLRIVGVCTRKIDEDVWYAKPYYHNPNGIETAHNDSSEAIDAVVAAYTGDLDLSIIPQKSKVIYRLTLLSEELDEFGNPWAFQEIFSIDEDVEIDWNLWLLGYSQAQEQDFQLIKKTQIIDDNDDLKQL